MRLILIETELGVRLGVRLKLIETETETGSEIETGSETEAGSETETGNETETTVTV